MIFCLCPVDERPGVHTERSGGGAGVLGRVTVMRDRRLPTASPVLWKQRAATCELGRDVRWSSMAGSPVIWSRPHAERPSGESDCGTPDPRVKDWKPKTAATGRRKAHV